MTAGGEPPRGPWRKLVLIVIAFFLAVLIFALVSERHDGPVPTASPETQAETAP
jgi:YbbR domain-containing protein